MTITRPGQPTPIPRPGTGPQILPDDHSSEEREERKTKPQEDTDLHPQEISREKMESEMPADPDPDDPVSP